MKTALIMEGGAMRGMFTCGVIDVLMENSIIFDGAAGVSAGAVFGCNFKSGQIGRPIRYNKKQNTTPVMKLLLRRIPKIREAMEHRHEMYNRQMDELDRMEAEKTALIIRPPEDLKIGHTEKNLDVLERVYQIGRKEAEKRLQKIRHWLQQRAENMKDFNS